MRIASRTFVALAAALFLIGACGGTSTIRGMIVVFDVDSDMGSWDACGGRGDYSDMAPGASVTFDDPDGDVLGRGSLRSFTGDDADLLAVNDTSDVAEELFADLKRGSGIVCALAFDVEVDDADAYVIELAGRRGGLTYTREDLVRHGYRIALQLGRGALGGADT